MGFRLVLKSVTLNDRERRNYFILSYFAELGSFQGPLRKVVEDTPILSRQKCSPKNLVLAVCHLWRYAQGITSARTLN